jgi:TRAP-type C4-dicarboxylate transport system permease small subunit
MNIPIVVERMSDRWRKVFAIFAELVALAFAGVILIFGGIQIASLAMGQMTSSLGLPIGVFYVILPISGLINIIYTALNIVDIATDSEMVEREG